MKARKPPLKGSFQACEWTDNVNPHDTESRAASRAIMNLGTRLLSLQEEIQQRIAADLHDSTCQHLIAASLSVGRLKQTTNVSGGAETICDDIDSSIDLALREIRAFAYLLHPQNLLRDGLKATIEEYVGGFSARTLLKSTCEIAPVVARLPYETQRSLFRVIQEALTNVFRHAKAKEVRITIEANRDHLRLRVSDDGCGMPNGRTKPGREALSIGVGIPGMRTRVNQLGGSFEIQSSTTGPHCTALCVEIPHPFSSKAVSETPHGAIGGPERRTLSRDGPLTAFGASQDYRH
jgi:two-component system, NarL family, sensor kinase